MYSVMTAEEYLHSGFDNINCRFIFIDETEQIGVVSNFFPDEPENFYLIRPADLILFHANHRKHDYVKMKLHCKQIVLEKVCQIEKY